VAVISRTIPLIMTLALLVIAGCAPSQPRMRGPGAGPEVASVGTAVALFRQVCLNTGAREAEIRIAADRPPFRLNFEQDIYYNQKYNLSFRPGLWDGKPACSMVAATHQPKQLRAALSREARSRGFAIVTRIPSELQAPEGVYVNAIVVRR